MVIIELIAVTCLLPDIKTYLLQTDGIGFSII